MDEWIRWIGGLVVTGIVGGVLWMLRLERRLNAKVDRAQYEHDSERDRTLAREDRREIMACLERINERGEKRDEYMHTFRHDMNDAFNEINVKLATVTRRDARNDR